VTVDDGAPPMRDGEKIAAPLTSQKMGKASPVAVDAGKGFMKACEEIAASTAIQKAGKVPLATMDAPNGELGEVVQPHNWPTTTSTVHYWEVTYRSM
jgi:hypothetical protein